MRAHAAAQQSREARDAPPPRIAPPRKSMREERGGCGRRRGKVRGERAGGRKGRARAAAAAHAAARSVRRPLPRVTKPTSGARGWRRKRRSALRRERVDADAPTPRSRRARDGDEADHRGEEPVAEKRSKRRATRAGARRRARGQGRARAMPAACRRARGVGQTRLKVRRRGRPWPRASANSPRSARG